VRKAVLAAVISALVPWAAGQRSPSHFPPGSSSHSGFPRWSAYPVPFFSGASYDSADFGLPNVPPPAVVVFQAPVSPEPVPPPAPVQPLLIELRGGRYVRLSDEQNADTSASETAAALEPDRAPGVSSPPEQRLALLVFRDGHREEVSAYTISGGVLYIPGNFYVDGSWNRKVELASLNLTETVEGNRTRRIHFLLPTAPNEVIVGP